MGGDLCEKNKRNILLTTMSTSNYKGDYRFYYYYTKSQNNEKKYCNGISALEPGTKYFLSKYHKNLENYKAELEQLFLLHEALKKERNCSNHASEKGVRLPSKVVSKAIDIYIKKANLLWEKLSL